MTLKIFVIGNLDKNFLQKRQEVMQKSRADLVMILNRDIKVSNYQRALVRFRQDPKLFAVTFSPQSSETGRIREVDVANGGSSIYNRKIWNEIGGIDPMFEPYWWDDVDYSYRARKAGYRIIEDGTVKVEQIAPMGTDILKRNLKSIMIERRNYFLFLKKHKPKYYKRVMWSPKALPFALWAEWRFKKFRGGIK